MLLLGNKIVRLAEVFSPHYNVPELDVFKISGRLNLPKTSTITLCNYLNKIEDEDPNCSIGKKLLELDSMG